MNDKILEKVYPAIVGALTTFIAQFVVRKLWQVATGDTPPDPTILTCPRAKRSPGSSPRRSASAWLRC